MKLIVQADDFAMTDALAEGIIYAAKNGILTQTGLMTCGPNAEYYAKRMMSECPHIALGLEYNLVSGRPLCDPKDVPTLVDENGKFIRSVVHKQMDKENVNHVSYEDSYKEIEAQTLKFIEITGHKPYFCGLHSYHNPNMYKAWEDIVAKYDLRTSQTLIDATGMPKWSMGPWYPLRGNADGPKFDYQYSFDPLQMFKDGEVGYITDYVNDKDHISFLHTHAGYIDRDLIDMSTLTLTRLLELDLITSDYVKNWVKENNVELVNARDLLGSYTD